MQVRGLLDVQRQRVRAALADSSADARTLDELATFVVAVNQSLGVLSRAGTSDAELRSVTRLAAGGISAPGHRQREPALISVGLDPCWRSLGHDL
ncbi:hypothetical protein [Streptomyces sp. NPDC050988]|uniref:hypothetical protein n=1 Tax=Streptomyces sp. NPDC050988 TaxID=3365637 RepID=UPI00379F8368